MAEITVTINKSQKVYPEGVSIKEVLEDTFSKDEVKKIIAADVDGTVTDLSAVPAAGSSITPVTFDSPAGKAVYWHSSAHVMAMAVKKLFPDAKLAIGPSIETGFYYDFDVPQPFTDADLNKITKQMKKIIGGNFPFVRSGKGKEEALDELKETGEIYKHELAEELEDSQVSFYSNDSFVDMCRGPHVPSTGYIKAFKLMKVAGAYWRGSEKNKQLQRIYGVSFPTKDELNEYLTLMEEAEKRDHRRLGKDLDLFSASEDVGAGLIHWHPKGGRIRSIVEQFWRDEHYKGGYEIVYSPHIGQANLWETSGHLGFYEENMYAPMDIDGQEYFIKPMNCPFHIQIYKNGLRSYRDLPLRWAELGTVYRYEKSGVLHGLLRVRGFTQDDAHIFCTPDQMEAEVRRTVQFALGMLRTFGFSEISSYLSTRPEKAVGEEERWDQATESLRKAMEAESIECKVDEGGGAFYGPKIDLKIKDALKREWQLGTIQFDFNLPERFDLSYIAEDGKEHRPYMIHRALLGSIERFFGILIEHYAGAFPVWLAPVQVLVAPVSEKTGEYAQQVAAKLREAGIRTELDDRNEKIGYKIREAEKQKTPYMLVVGPKEEQEGTVAVRKRRAGDCGAVALDAFIGTVTGDIREKVIF